MKKFILGLIIGGLIFGCLGVYAAYQFKANEIKFTPSNGNWEVSTVEEAINYLENLSCKTVTDALFETLYTHAGSRSTRSYTFTKDYDFIIGAGAASNNYANDNAGMTFSISSDTAELKNSYQQYTGGYRRFDAFVYSNVKANNTSSMYVGYGGKGVLYGLRARKPMNFEKLLDQVASSGTASYTFTKDYDYIFVLLGTAGGGATPTFESYSYIPIYQFLYSSSGDGGSSRLETYVYKFVEKDDVINIPMPSGTKLIVYGFSKA